ncbi:hypothetical protein [Streptosporangium sandarakinum]|uniref:hypothetical protein n=1 Tax=Streptosporangium sandarakinum TaxID=1260955 RepID=UPI0037B47BAB
MANLVYKRVSTDQQSTARQNLVIAEADGWLGEIEGIDLTLTFLRQKRDQTRRLARVTPTHLGMPGMPAPSET